VAGAIQPVPERNGMNGSNVADRVAGEREIACTPDAEPKEKNIEL